MGEPWQKRFNMQQDKSNFWLLELVQLQRRILKAILITENVTF